MARAQSRRAPHLAAAMLLAGAVACAATAPAVPVGAADAAVILVPTSSAPLGPCAAELAATYCSAADAQAARAACVARLSVADVATCDPALGCLTLYSPTHAGPCVAGPTYSSASACASPVDDTCSFYRGCLEVAAPCGAEGYALAFGEPLCYVFLQHRDDFSPAGQHWLQSVRACLQRQLAVQLAQPATSCDALSAQAYASHTTCYTAPDDSFCALATGDVAALVAIVAPYLGNPQVAAQVGTVAGICSGNGP